MSGGGAPGRPLYRYELRDITTLRVGDEVADTDPDLVFPDDYDLDACEWATVNLVVARHADCIDLALDGYEVFGHAGELVIRRIPTVTRLSEEVW